MDIRAAEISSILKSQIANFGAEAGEAAASEAVGRSFATTWPNGRHLIPPLRLDHLFADPPIVPLAVAGQPHLTRVEIRLRDGRVLRGEQPDVRGSETDHDTAREDVARRLH